MVERFDLPTPEFSHPVRVDRLPDQTIALHADEAARAALAKRFALAAIDDLRAHATLERTEAGIRLTGHLDAAIQQDCAVSGEPFANTIAENFDLLYVTHAPDPAEEEEYELSEDELDQIVIEGDTIDVGEAVAQTLGVSIDPYARGPQADTARAQSGLASDEDRPATGPLAEALKGLKPD